MPQRRIHRLEVQFDDLFPSPSVRLLDRILNGSNGLLFWQHAAQREEARLHHGVDPQAETGLVCHPISINDMEVELLLQDLLLGTARQLVPHLFRRVGAVQQEGGSVSSGSQYIELLDKVKLMAGDEVGRLDEIRCLDWVGPKPQMGNGARTRFLGVIDEIALGVPRGLLADDLDGVLVRTDGPVCTETIEKGPHRALRLNLERRVELQAGHRDIIPDADGEVVLR